MRAKEPKEKATPQRCVCNKVPIMVKAKGAYFYACPNHLYCAMRGAWRSKEEEAIKSWNTAVDEERYRRKKKEH